MEELLSGLIGDPPGKPDPLGDLRILSRRSHPPGIGGIGGQAPGADQAPGKVPKLGQGRNQHVLCLSGDQRAEAEEGRGLVGAGALGRWGRVGSGDHHSDPFPGNPEGTLNALGRVAARDDDPSNGLQGPVLRLDQSTAFFGAEAGLVPQGVVNQGYDP